MKRYVGTRTPLTVEEWRERGFAGEPVDLNGGRIRDTGVFVVTDTGVDRLRHHVRHSPTGFEWGYGGSGPAELARCILIDVLGDAAKCPRCLGTDRICRECLEPSSIHGQQGEPRCAATGAEHRYGTCFDCDGGYTIGAPGYQRFKAEVIAHLPRDGFDLSEQDVRDWLVLP